ncbi:hypothetical protein DL767_010005 [Monosporascus sp. MG133]|nr:hypothetical protein DL767_010005 [Monosporascus sp. MG133]
MSSSKRQSVLPRVPAGPKAPANFSSSIIIADSALLTGNHTINVSSESVINPRAKLDSSNGRVTIGRRCIIHERTHIGATPMNPSPTDSRDGVMIHDYATVEVGATVEAGGTVIGEGTLVGVGCRVRKGAKIGKPGEEVPDFTVVYSNGTRRPDKRGVADLKNKVQARQIDVLRRLIPSNPAKFL